MVECGCRVVHYLPIGDKHYEHDSECFEVVHCSAHFRQWAKEIAGQQKYESALTVYLNGVADGLDALKTGL